MLLRKTWWLVIVTIVGCVGEINNSGGISDESMQFNCIGPYEYSDQFVLIRIDTIPSPHLNVMSMDVEKRTILTRVFLPNSRVCISLFNECQCVMNKCTEEPCYVEMRFRYKPSLWENSLNVSIVVNGERWYNVNIPHYDSLYRLGLTSIDIVRILNDTIIISICDSLYPVL